MRKKRDEKYQYDIITLLILLQYFLHCGGEINKAKKNEITALLLKWTPLK
jgi:hypothetical protein